jgi:hypothetical protein
MASRNSRPLLIIGVAVGIIYVASLVWLRSPAVAVADSDRVGAPTTAPSVVPDGAVTEAGNPMISRDTNAHSAEPLATAKWPNATPPANSDNSGTLQVPQLPASMAPDNDQSLARDASQTPVPPTELRVGPTGQSYEVRNFGASETESRNRVRENAIAALLADARRDPHAFAQARQLEREDVEAIISGRRQLPEPLIAGQMANAR